MSDPFLPHALSNASHAIARVAAQRLGYTEADVRVLMAMELDQDITPTAVAHATTMTKVEASRAVARLIEAGLVVSRRNPHDARGKLLRLTRKGERELAAITEESADLQRELLAMLAPREAAVLWVALKKLQAAVITKEQPEEGA